MTSGETPEQDSGQDSRLYYSIGEVAIRFGVNVSLIRYWSNEFSAWLKPHTNKKGNRYYTAEDIQMLERIRTLVKEQGFTLSGAKEKLLFRNENQTDNSETILLLKNIRNHFQSLKEELDKITEQE